MTFKNPHSFYDEIDRKEQEFKSIVLKMDEEFKKQRELKQKKIGKTLSPFNIINKKLSKRNRIRVNERKNTLQIDNKEIPGPRANLYCIKVNSRKQSNA